MAEPKLVEEVISFEVEGTNRGVWVTIVGPGGARTRFHLSIGQVRDLEAAMESVIAAGGAAVQDVLRAQQRLLHEPHALQEEEENDEQET